MVVAEDGYAVCPGGPTDGERAIEVNTAVVESVRQRNRVGMKRSNDIGSRREILGVNRLHGTCCHAAKTSLKMVRILRAQPQSLKA